MKILINGINANLRFSSAHLIPGHPSCGFIHGHSYFVDAEIEGERAGDFDFVVDFKDVKSSLRTICKTLDHRLLIPIYNKYMSFKDIEKEDLSVKLLEENDTLYFKVKDKGYSIPKSDCVILPLTHSSAESLAQYFTEQLIKDLKNKGYANLSSVSVCVNEGIGQGAMYKLDF